MKVHLKRNFNAPGDILFLFRNSPVEVDEEILPYLPSDSRIDGKTRDQTRREVLLKRRELGLDKPNAAANEIDYNGSGRMTSDEDLLKTAPKADPKTVEKPVTKATLDSNLTAAKEKLEAAQKELVAAKDEPSKGVAKSNLELAKKGVDEAEGALAAFEDDE